VAIETPILKRKRGFVFYDVQWGETGLLVERVTGEESRRCKYDRLQSNLKFKQANFQA
jgi:hypothetical protein